MGVRNRTSNTKKRFVVGPDDPIRKRDNATLAFVLHARYRTGPGENPFDFFTFHQFRQVVQTDNGLGFRLWTVPTPEEDSSVLFASRKGNFDDRGRMYNDDRYGSGRSYLMPQYDPMIRLQQRVWELVENGTIAPDRVILRVPNHKKFNDISEIDVEIGRWRSPGDAQDSLDNIEFRDRTWWEWRAASACGLDKEARKNSQYVGQLRLEPETHRACVGAAEGETENGVFVVPYSVFKGIGEAEEQREKFLQTRRSMPLDQARREADIQAGLRLIVVTYNERVTDADSGRERKPRGSEYYTVQVDWEEDAPAHLVELAKAPEHPDLDRVLQPTRRDFDRAYNAVGDMLRYARFEEYCDVDYLFDPWRQKIEQGTSDNEHESQQSEQDNERVNAPVAASSNDRRPVADVTVTRPDSSTESTSTASSRRGRRARRSRRTGPDYTMGGRYRDVQRDDLVLCDPDPPLEPGETLADEDRGCGLMLHPDWRSCPMCGLGYIFEDDHEYPDSKDAPDQSEVVDAKWPAKEQCLACRAPVSLSLIEPHQYCLNLECGMDLARDVLAQEASHVPVNSDETVKSETTESEAYESIDEDDELGNW